MATSRISMSYLSSYIKHWNTAEIHDSSQFKANECSIYAILILELQCMDRIFYWVCWSGKPSLVLQWLHYQRKDEVGGRGEGEEDFVVCCNCNRLSLISESARYRGKTSTLR